MRHGPDEGLAPASLTVVLEHGLRLGDTRRRRGSSARPAVEQRPPPVEIRTSSRWSRPRVRGSSRSPPPRGQHREQVADGERDDERRREAAALAAPDVAQPDLHVRGRNADAPQERGRGVLAADAEPVDSSASRRSMRTAAPDRRQRRERRREQPDERGRRRAPSRRCRRRRRPPRTSSRSSRRAALERTMPSTTPPTAPSAPSRSAVVTYTTRDLAAAGADRPHDPDLAGLLGDQRRHRVRDQHERREQCEDGDHAQQLRRTSRCPPSRASRRAHAPPAGRGSR